MTVGPLDAKSDIAGIQSWLERQGARVQLRRDERREVALYWVFFPPRASRAEAVEEVGKMKEQGISDVIVVPRGDMENAISLGVFSRTETRDRRLRELRSKGYEPNIGPRYRTTVASWIDVEVAPDVLTGEAVVERWPNVRVTGAACAEETGPSAAGQDGDGPEVAETPPARRFHFSGQAQ